MFNPETLMNKCPFKIMYSYEKHEKKNEFYQIFEIETLIIQIIDLLIFNIFKSH